MSEKKKNQTIKKIKKNENIDNVEKSVKKTSQITKKTKPTSVIKSKQKVKETSLNLFTYKGKNLVREGNILCYGNPEDDYIVLLEILDKKPDVKDISLSDKISIALFDRKKLIKDPNSMFLDFCERYGMFDALETAYMWISKT